jgi:hypothetical protein
MKMVIFGAGASFDSHFHYYEKDFNHTWRPPLANELFAPRNDSFLKIYNNYFGVKSLLSGLNVKEDLEDYFDLLWTKAKDENNKEILSLIVNLVYAIQELMLEISEKNKNIGLSNYSAIVNQANLYSNLKNQDVAFVSFNYDLLLENAISEVYVGGQSPLNHLDNYTNNRIKLFKPHGSANWGKKIKTIINRETDSHQKYFYEFKYDFDRIEEMLESDFELIYSDSKKRILPSSFYGETDIDYFFPQLLLPMKNKDEFIMPESQIKLLEEITPNVNEILIIGWKGNEEKFNTLLRNYLMDRDVSITVVSSNDNDSNYRKILPNAHFKIFNERAEVPFIDNTKPQTEMKFRRGYYEANHGSFSSYIINTEKGLYDSFFPI